MKNLVINLGKPQPKQEIFLKDTHKHVAFGGARGGGKSWSLDFKAKVLCPKYAGIKIGIVRTTYPEVERNHIEPLKEDLVRKAGVATYNDSKKRITFKNGSRIYFFYCNSDRDAEKFSGIELDVLMLDEATHFKKEWIDKMRACVRGVNDFPKRIYYTCNPDGVGMFYIKRLFIDRKFEAGENPDDYSFIQSLLTDNEALMKSDPTYMAYLESLPPKLKQAWLMGDWNCMEGAFFEDFRVTPDPQKCMEHGIDPETAYMERRWTHVIKPFDIPKSWNIWRSYDFGYGKPASLGWWAIDHDGILYRILEYYFCTGEPNVGMRLSAGEQFDRIAEVEREHPWLKGKKIQGVADPAIWEGSHGISIEEEADKRGIWFQKGVNDRVAGWMQMHERLKFDENGFPMMYVFENCKDFIRTIPMMVYDEHKPEDLDTDLEDHIADESRYMCMARPIAPRIAVETKPIISDPLNQFNKLERYSRKAIFLRK